MIFTGNKEFDRGIAEESLADYFVMYGGVRRGMSLNGLTEQEYLIIRETIRDNLMRSYRMRAIDFYRK